MNATGIRDPTSARKKRTGNTQSEDATMFPNPYAFMKKASADSVACPVKSAIVDREVTMTVGPLTPTVEQRAPADGRMNVAASRNGSGGVKELTSRSKMLSANFSIDFAKTPSGSSAAIGGESVPTRYQSKERVQHSVDYAADPVASSSKSRLPTSAVQPSIATATRPSQAEATSAARSSLAPKPVLKGARTDARGRERPPANKAFEYVLRPEAVVRCSVSDALSMEREKDMAHDFFWIGRVPCRTVILVGILVGVGCWDKRVVYTLDDGLGVIDCIVKVSSTTSASGPPPPPRPIARVGAFVSIKGRLEPKYDTRVLNIDEISLCRTANEELEHTQLVRKLHKEHYDLEETFVVPPPIVLPPVEPTTPIRSVLKEGRQHGGDDSGTPKRRIGEESIPPMSSPVSVAASLSSSPVRPLTPQQDKPDEGQPRALPVRLRHPSRLHTGDLTENTFRIYLKHYIDHAHLIPDGVTDVHSTPTKRRRTSLTPTHGPETPRPIKKGKGRERERSPDEESQTLGLTLSFLRRVPELHLLAVRVVRAVSARQAREERKKKGEIVTVSDRSRVSGKEKSRKERPPQVPPDKLRARMKRLFQWGLVQLLQDGSIMLWDGSMRPCPADDMIFGGDASVLLWKTHSTISSFSTSTNGTLTSASIWDNDDDISELFPSPPPSPANAEEAYAPMTPELLLPSVRSALERVLKRKRKEGNPYAGASLNEVMRSVVRGDDRFRWALEWSVEDALKVLQKRGETRKMKSEEWDLIGS